MVRIAEHLGPGSVGRDMPSIEPGDGRDLPGMPAHSLQSIRPHHEHDVSRGTQERLVYDELVVAVLVKTFQAGTVAPYTMHARGGIAGKDEPLRLAGVKLRM